MLLHFLKQGVLGIKQIVDMDIHLQKLVLLEKLLKVKIESLILKVKALLKFAEEEEKKGSLSSLSLDRFN